MDKKTLRDKYKKLRDRLNSEQVDTLSLQLANTALTLPIWDKQYYHLFLTIETKQEVRTDYLLHILQGRDKSVVVSKTHFESNRMSHILLEDATEIRQSHYGIPEPTDGIPVDPEMLDVVFVPLLAYDVRGHRIGYGKGFYDRFLAQCRDNTLFVGLSFFAPEPVVPSEATDIPLHYTITPTKIYSFISKT